MEKKPYLLKHKNVDVALLLLNEVGEMQDAQILL